EHRQRCARGLAVSSPAGDTPECQPSASPRRPPPPSEWRETSLKVIPIQACWASRPQRHPSFQPLCYTSPFPWPCMHLQLNRDTLNSIATMQDRAMQMLYSLALDPIAETTGDRNSYGFRRERSTADAIEQCFNVLGRKDSAPWILEGDIAACFDEL